MKRRISALLFAVLTALFLTGCAKKDMKEEAPAASRADAAGTYLLSVKEKADAIRASLEKDVLTQSEMNVKSGELADLWNEALSYLLGEAEKVLTEDKKNALASEQAVWLENRAKAMEAAGREYEGGSAYALIVNMEEANLTQARVYEVYDLIK